jgi:hypothetical protein
MVRYVGSVVAVSLLAFCGCGAYGFPYGNGYGGYGGYPSYGNPYGSSGYGSPYYPQSYGYSYDPYASQYGYPNGYAAPPPVVVGSPPPEVIVEDSRSYQYPAADSGERRRRWQAAREQYRNRFPNTPTSEDPQVNPDPTQTPSPGNGSLNPQDPRQGGQWVRGGGSRSPQVDNSGAASGNWRQSQRLNSGARAPVSGEQGQGVRSWQTGRTTGQFTDGRVQSQPRMRTSPFGGSAATSMPSTPQMRQQPMVRQSGAPAAAPRMSQSPSTVRSPRPMASGPTRSAPQPAASQARPRSSGQTRGEARTFGQRFQ